MKYLPSILFFCFLASSCLANDNTLQWGACPSHLKATGNQQCTIVKQPLNHANPDSAQIDVLLMRSLGEAQTKNGQLWFLNGGPGDSLDTFSYPMDKWAQTHPDYDYYAMEHRGTGLSTYLTCSDEPASPSCLKELVDIWGDNLGFFNTTQASHDLAAAMNITADNKDRFLYGLSYGTYFIQRFISIYDTMVNGVIIDGVVIPNSDQNGLFAIDQYDANFHKLALDVAAKCDQDETCGSKLQTLGPDTQTVIEQTFQIIDQGKICKPLQSMVTRQSLRHVSADLISDYGGRQLYPAMIYRINRCSPEDVNIITTMFEEDDTPETQDEILGFNQNLNTNIIVNELIGGKNLIQAQKESNNYFAATDETIEHYLSLEQTNWPQYPTDQYTHKWTESTLPVLILNGDMDPATPFSFASQVKDHLKGQYQYLVRLPGIPHGTLFLSLMKNTPLEEAETCSSQLMFNFIKDVTKTPDTSCTERLIQPDFSGTSNGAKNAAKNFFGSDAVWN